MAFLRCIESALMAVMGLFMAGFALSDLYWQVLNPKYSWLTFVAGVVSVLVGVALLFNAERRPRPTEFLSVAVFLSLALVAISVPHSLVPGAVEPDATLGKDTRYAGGSLTLHYDDDAVPVTEITHQGETYTRMNLAELLAGEEGGWAEAGRRFVVQGLVLRSPELDAAGYIGVGRLFINCCFADAVGVGALVRVDRPEEYKAGSWVRALGVLREDAPLPGLRLRMTGSLATVRSERFLLEGVLVEETPVEGVPFILEIKGEPPFEY